MAAQGYRLKDDGGETLRNPADRGGQARYLLQPLGRNGQHLSARAHHRREVDGLACEHVQLTKVAARTVDGYRAYLSGEVLDGLNLTLEDDDEVVGAILLRKEYLLRKEICSG